MFIMHAIIKLNMENPHTQFYRWISARLSASFPSENRPPVNSYDEGMFLQLNLIKLVTISSYERFHI